MASSKPADQSQAKNKDNEKEKPVSNGVKKDETEELVCAPTGKDTQTNGGRAKRTKI